MADGGFAGRWFAQALDDETRILKRHDIVLERIHPPMERHLEAIALETSVKRPAAEVEVSDDKRGIGVVRLK